MLLSSRPRSVVELAAADVVVTVIVAIELVVELVAEHGRAAADRLASPDIAAAVAPVVAAVAGGITVAIVAFEP